MSSQSIGESQIDPQLPVRTYALLSWRPAQNPSHRHQLDLSSQPRARLPEVEAGPGPAAGTNGRSANFNCPERAYVARGVAALAAAGDADRWAGTIVSARQLADAYGVTDTDGSRPDCWAYLAAYGWEREDGEGIDRFR